MKMKNLSVFLILATLAVFNTAWATDLKFSGNVVKPVEITPDKNTGLEKLYVLYSCQGVKASYSYSGTAPTWSRYSNLGGGYAEPVDDSLITNENGVSTLNAVQGDCGYIVTDNGRQICFWITDYEQHRLVLTSVEPAAQQQCESTILDMRGNGAPIYYFSIDGRRCTLDRGIRVEYDTQELDKGGSDASPEFVEVQATKNFDSFEETLTIIPPVYARTVFTVSGDKFLEAWGEGISVESSMFSPYAVAVCTEAIAEEAVVTDEENPVGSNQITSGTTGLGGSAPCDISFVAHVTEGVLHNEWQFSDDPEFENITYRINDQTLDYTFMDEGTTYVRFVGSNADGSCEDVGDVYTVTIASSELRCPNVFSPNASPGVNDEWKVSYRSLVDFECWIFDRYGQEIFHFTDPSLGWDGKYKGKYVKPGVYFYVIQATGSDGKKYKKSGDINILRQKNYSIGDGGGTVVE